MKKSNFLLFLLAGLMLSACNSGSTATSQPQQSSTTIPARIDQLGTLFGLDTGLQENTNAAVSGGFAYYSTVYNTGTTTLSITSVDATDVSGAPAVAFSADSTRCDAISAGSSCVVRVIFKPSNVVIPADLNSIVNLHWSNGKVSYFPVYGATLQTALNIESASVDMPKVIVPNSNGLAEGVITYVNPTADSQTIDASTIMVNPTTIDDNNWRFKTDCDGRGSNTVSAYGTCSIIYRFKTLTSCINGNCPIYNITIPSTNTNPDSSNVGKVTYSTANTSIAQSLNLVQPLAIIGNYGGAVSVSSGTNSTWVFTNIGNAVVTGLSFTGLGSLSQTNACTNVLPGDSCAVTFTLPSGATAPTSIQIDTTGNTCGNITCGGATIPITQQELTVSAVAEDFGINHAGATLVQSVWITNLGPVTLNSVSAVLTGNAAFTANIVGADINDISIAAFSSREVSITYTAPATDATQSALLTISASGQTAKTVQLSARSESTAAQYMGYILNQGAANVSVCPIIDGNSFGDCSLTTPNSPNGTNPLLNGSPIGIAVNNNYAYMSVNNGIASTIVTCNITDHVQFTNCTSVPTVSLFPRALRASQLAVNNNTMYFSSGDNTGNGYMIWCPINASDGSIIQAGCQNVGARNIGTYDFGVTVSGNHLYGVTTGNGESLPPSVNILTLDANGNIESGSGIIDLGLNSSGDSTFISPRMMTVSNGYAYITDPGYNDTGTSVIGCKIDSNTGRFSDCVPQFGALNGDPTTAAFDGPVGIASLNNNIFALNFGPGGAPYPNNAAICNEDLGNSADISCTISSGLNSLGISTFSIPIGMAIAGFN